MAIVFPFIIQQNNVMSFEAQVSQNDTLIIPVGLRRGVTVTLIVSSGSGKIQYTNGRREDVIANTTSDFAWIDWSNGVVSANDQNQFGPISALKIVSSSGTQFMTIQGD